MMLEQQHSLALYHAPVSTCSQRVRMGLIEKGLSWEDRQLSLAKQEHLSPAFLQINPNGLVPALVHNGLVVADSTVILEYLEDVFPDVPLRPTDPHERARMRMWQHYIDEVPTPATRIPSFHMSFGQHLRKMSATARATYAAHRPLRKHMYSKFGDDGFTQVELEAAMEQLDQTFARANAALEQTHWLTGAMFTFADISLLPTFVRMEDLGLTHLFDGRRAARRWYDAITARASFGQAYFPGSRDL